MPGKPTLNRGRLIAALRAHKGLPIRDQLARVAADYGEGMTLGELICACVESTPARIILRTRGDEVSHDH